MTAERPSAFRRVVAACLLLCVWLLAPVLARAEDGPICAWLARQLPAVDADGLDNDVYLGAGSTWLSEDLKKRYPEGTPAQDTTGTRLQLKHIQTALANSAVLNQSDNGQLLKARLLEELEFIDAALARLDASLPVSLDELKEVYGLARLDQSSHQETCAGTAYTTNSLFFADAARSEQIVLRIAPQATAGVPGLEIPVASAPIAFFTVEEASEFRAALTAVRALLNGPLLKAVERASIRLTRIDRGWSNYLEHGFSQFPWEAAVNSLGELHWHDAPKTQWVLLHPEVATVIDARSVEHASVAGALLVHALGFIGYGGATRAWFLGASATGAVTTSTSFGLGCGGTLHFGHAKVYAHIPHVSIAGLLFATERGRIAPFIGLSLDLWRLVSDSGESIFHNRLLNQQ